jgi:hypothetical protein
MKRISTLLLTAGAFLALTQLTVAQTGVTRYYRGAIGSNHIQMALTFNGNDVTGKYSYDRVGEEINVKGKLDAEGKLELVEFGPNNKPTGKFSCKTPFNDPEPECYWSKPTGGSESPFTINEQNIAFTGGLKLVPKLITNKPKGILISYPQLESTGTLSPAAQKFNRRALAMAQKSTSDFSPIDGKGVLDANYTVLLGTNDLISIELLAYEDGGGAHPNDIWSALTYDLAADKVLKLEDLFKPGSDYKTAIAKYLTDDINRRAVELEKSEARRENRQPRNQDEPLVSADQLTEISDFALTPKGLVVYFDFAHVIAYFDKNLVPYSVLKEYLKPGGPAEVVSGLKTQSPK